jgi:hypothetical protein
MGGQEPSTETPLTCRGRVWSRRFDRVRGGWVRGPESSAPSRTYGINWEFGFVTSPRSNPDRWQNVTDHAPVSSDAHSPVPPGERHAWWMYSIYVVFALGVALLGLTAYVIVAAPGLFKVDLPGALLGIAAFLIGLAVLDRLPHEVRVGAESVEFRYFLSSITLRWDQLAAPSMVGKRFVAFRAVTGAKGVWGSLTVTDAQARGILAHPACPAFELPPELAATQSTG